LVQECEKYLQEKKGIQSMDHASCKHLKEFVLRAEKGRKLTKKTYAMAILYYYECKGDYSQLKCLKKIVSDFSNQ